MSGRGFSDCPEHWITVAALAVVLLTLPRDKEGKVFWLITSALFTLFAMLAIYFTTP